MKIIIRTSMKINFKQLKNFNKSNINKVDDNTAIIYKIKNNRQNLYIGIAGRHEGQNRLLAHLNNKKDKIPGATKFQYTEVANKEIAKNIEKSIIKKEQPKFNIQNK